MSGNVVMVGLMLAGFGVPLLAQTPEVIPPAFENPAENAGQTGENEDDSGPDAFDASAPKQVFFQKACLVELIGSSGCRKNHFVTTSLLEVFPGGLLE